MPLNGCQKAVPLFLSLQRYVAVSLLGNGETFDSAFLINIVSRKSERKWLAGVGRKASTT